MPKLAGLVAVTLLVIVAVAYWTHRVSRDHGDERHDPQVAERPSQRDSSTASRRPARPSSGNYQPRPAAAVGGANGKRPSGTRPSAAARSNTGPPAARPAGTKSAGTKSAGTRSTSTRSIGTRPAGEIAAGRQPEAEQQLLAPPDDGRTQRQGDDVAKSRRFGLTDRVGWLRRTDVDSEMWPEESFGGVTDEQFWDDMSSDKPLANTARTAQSDGDARPRPESRQARPGQSRLGPLPASSIERAPAPVPLAQPATQAFPVAGQHAAGSRTGPMAAYTGPQAAFTGPQPAYKDPQPLAYKDSPPPAYKDPQPTAYTGPQRAYTGSQPVQTGPLSARQAAARPGTQPQAYSQPQPLPQHVPPTQAQSPAQSSSPAQGMPAIKSLPANGTGSRPVATGAQQVSRGRHSSGEDPLTSDKFSLRSAPDGRSYQAARRPRDLTREQYDAALAQETQTFSMSDTDGGSGAYPIQPLPASTGVPRRKHGGDRQSGSGAYAYGRDGNGATGHPQPYSQQPANPVPPYSDDFSDYSGRDSQPRRAASARDIPARDIPARDIPARDIQARDGGSRDGYGRPGRPVYPDKRGQYDPRGGERR